MSSTRTARLVAVVIGLAAMSGMALFLACSTPGGGGTADRGSAEDFQVTFPESGDAVLVIERVDGTGSATYFGAADDDADEVTFARLEIETEGATTVVSLDDQGRPTEVAADGTLIAASYNPDGTVNYEVSENGEVLQSGANIPMGELDGSEIVAQIEELGAEVKAIGSYAQLPLDMLSQIGLGRFVTAAITQRGYVNPPKRAISELPVYWCLVDRYRPSDGDVLDLWSRAINLYGVERDQIIAVCMELGGSDEYCTNVSNNSLSAHDAFIQLCEIVGSGWVDDLWDDPDCGCPKLPCPSLFVCTDGQCVPSCTGQEGDCPEGLDCDTDSGQCVGQEDQEDDGTGDDTGDDTGDGEAGVTLSGPEDLAGCWRVTSAHSEEEGAAELKFHAFVLDINEDGDLRSVWFEMENVETTEVGFLEVVRFLEANTGLIGSDVGNAQQSVVVDGATGSITFSFEASDGEDLRGLDIRGITFFSDPVDSFLADTVNGVVFEGSMDTDREFFPPALGDRMRCPQAADDNAIAQEELTEEDVDCGEGTALIMPVLLLGLAGIKLRRSWS
ncbi:MAG: hypothetical protein JSV19_09610 [Phycisphaerales bacterium]|nr:MAG: hypothetical protein JSV19_09610 [Phycisphaerales bacterium]